MKVRGSIRPEGRVAVPPPAAGPLADFQTILAGFRIEQQPRDAFEDTLVSRLARSAWRLQVLAQREFDGNGVEDATRRSAAIARSFSNALRLLQSLREMRGRKAA